MILHVHTYIHCFGTDAGFQWSNFTDTLDYLVFHEMQI